MTLTILVTGADGQVGQELVSQGRTERHRIVGCSKSLLDITDRDAVRAVVKESQPNIIINAAAYTAVDNAEQEPEKALQVNRDGPAYLAQECASAGIPLIQISTDYVFPGTATSPYREDAAMLPLGAYGRSKAEGEAAVRETIANHLILRTAWIFSAQGQNFVKTMLRVGAERKHLRVVDDQFGCPTSAADIAASLLKMANRSAQSQFDHWGTYHFVNTGVTNWWSFAREIFHQATLLTRRPEPFVEPITTAEYPLPAKRPTYSVLDCSRLRKIFEIDIRPWPLALREVVEKLLVHANPNG